MVRFTSLRICYLGISEKTSESVTCVKIGRKKIGPEDSGSIVEGKFLKLLNNKKVK